MSLLLAQEDQVAQSSRSFLEEAALNAVGPLITAVLGGLIIGLFASWIARRAQERREDHHLRTDLIDQLTAAASSLYFALQQYPRSERGTRDDKDRRLLRDALDTQYRESRVEGTVLERRLAAYFDDFEMRCLWHTIMYVLTDRYFKLTDQEREPPLKSSGCLDHPGLQAEDLKDWEGKVRQYYLDTLDGLTAGVLQRDLRRSGGSRSAGRPRAASPGRPT